MNADLAADYRKALKLWEAEVNAAGGLLGRPVELRLLDERPRRRRASRSSTRRLIVEERAQLLIGPYGSAATRAARERRSASGA